MGVIAKLSSFIYEWYIFFKILSSLNRISSCIKINSLLKCKHYDEIQSKHRQKRNPLSVA